MKLGLVTPEQFDAWVRPEEMATTATARLRWTRASLRSRARCARSLAIADDRFYAPRRAVEALLAMYPNARSELAVVTPDGAGARAIGHFGFFKGVHRARLWPEALGWLLGALDPSRGRGGLVPWPGPAAPAALDRGGKPA